MSCGDSILAMRPDHRGEGGSIPTSPLHLFVENARFDEALEFVRTFHYLGTLPSSSRTNFAVRVEGRIEALASYGPCHAPRLPQDMLELRRLVKRPGSTVPLSKFLSATLRLLKATGVPGVLTWADPKAGHHGGIYQATNWIYNEPNSYNWNSHFITDTGAVVDHREAFKRFGTSSKKKVLEMNPTWSSFLPVMKYRYLMPLNVDKETLITKLNARELPYPKPAKDGAREKRIPGKWRPDRKRGP